MIIRIPENKLLETIKNTSKNSLHKDDIAVFMDQFNKIKDRSFWNDDSSYKFVDKCLKELISSNTKIIDVGCYIGTLPLFLKHLNLWNKVNYTGTDIIECAMEITKSNFPEGEFFESDAHSFITDKYFDIVYSKGTIISTYYPDKALNSILDIPSKYVLLAHQPFFYFEPDTNSAYENILVVTNNSMYTSTVLYFSYFKAELIRRNIKILKMKKRYFPVRVKNFSNYYLYDILLKKAV